MTITDRDEEQGKIIPLFGRDEMNLIEFPFGPISATSAKTLDVEQVMWDPKLRANVIRRLIITGSDKWGLPRAIDDKVFLGLQTLTCKSGYKSQTIPFTRYDLCRAIRWEPDGRSYRRLEESLDRIKGTTLKFKDAWYDNAEKQYKSKAFSVIDEYEICSREQIARARLSGRSAAPNSSYFKWSDVMWKSFQDGYIKKIDLEMFNCIADGRRREVPARLFRILDKRFYKKSIARFRLRRLCIGTIGLSQKYTPAQMFRVLERAVKVLIDYGYLEEWWYTGASDNPLLHFRRRVSAKQERSDVVHRSIGLHYDSGRSAEVVAEADDSLKRWLMSSSEKELEELETEALEVEFGSAFERSMVQTERHKGTPILKSGRTRQDYVRKFFLECEATPSGRLLIGA